MLYRRKVLLALAQSFRGALSKTDFQKHLFLYTRFQKTASFDFVPYKFGCYSFLAEADRQALVHKGYHMDTGRWTQDYIGRLKTADRSLLISHKQHLGHLQGMELVRYVYTRYPYYAIKSEITDKILSTEELKRVKDSSPQLQGTSLFTIGYEGKTIERYLNQLIKHGIDILCDVRKNPLSRKYGFSKRSLQRFTEAVGVEYRHYPNLGISSMMRRSLKTQEDYNRLFAQYERTILSQGDVDLQHIISLLGKGKRVALTCFERDHRQCHRSRVANRIIEQVPWQFPSMDI